MFYNNTIYSTGCHLLLNMLDESFWNSIWSVLLQFLDNSQKHLLNYLSRKDSAWKKQAEVKPTPESFTHPATKPWPKLLVNSCGILLKLNAFHRNCLSLISCLFRRIQTTSTCSGHSEHGTAPNAIQWSILRLTTFSDQWLGEIHGMPWEYESVGEKPRVLGSHAQRMLNILHASSRWPLPS